MAESSESIEKGEIEGEEIVEKNKFKTKAQKKKEKKQEKKKEKEKEMEEKMKIKREKEKVKDKDKKRRNKEKKEEEAKNVEPDEIVTSVIAELEKKYPKPSLRCSESKLVYMGNISPSLQERDVEEFFKDAGEIEWVQIQKAGDELLGFGHVRFHTYEAAKKALQLNGEKLIDHRVELSESEEWTVYDELAPSKWHNYLFMGNLSPSVTQEIIVEFFKDAGKVVSVHLIREDDPFEGCGYHAHVLFPSSTEAHKAVRRHGQMLLDRDVKLYLATKDTVWDYSYKIRGCYADRGPWR